MTFKTTTLYVIIKGLTVDRKVFQGLNLKQLEKIQKQQSRPKQSKLYWGTGRGNLIYDVFHSWDYALCFHLNYSSSELQ